jgi:hypothetical protein
MIKLDELGENLPSCLGLVWQTLDEILPMLKNISNALFRHINIIGFGPDKNTRTSNCAVVSTAI